LVYLIFESLQPKLFIARSFDVNKPGIGPEELVGGIIGGSLIQGKLSVDDEIEIRTGRKIEEQNKDINSSIDYAVNISQRAV